MPEKYFYTDGVATYTLHTGPTTLPEQPPVRGRGEAIVCLHGAGGNAALFRDVMERLGDDHGLIAFDQPGHGRSGELDSLGSIDRMADFTRAFVEKLALGPVVLLGHDMGAAVALRVALDAPGSVRALVLCSAGARFVLGDEELDRARLVREGKARRAFDPRLFSKQTSPEIMRRGFMESLKTDPRATHGDLLACRDWDDRGRFGEIEVPTAVLVGEDERSDVAEQARALTAGIPGAEDGVVTGAGHSILLEAPDALAAEVRRFLAALPARQGGAGA